MTQLFVREIPETGPTRGVPFSSKKNAPQDSRFSTGETIYDVLGNKHVYGGVCFNPNVSLDAYAKYDEKSGKVFVGVNNHDVVTEKAVQEYLETHEVSVEELSCTFFTYVTHRKITHRATTPELTFHVGIGETAEDARFHVALKALLKHAADASYGYDLAHSKVLNMENYI